MSKANPTELDVLALVLNGVALPGGYGGNVYVALHSSDPGENGDQSTNEISYTGYARIAVTRDNSGAGFSTSGNPRLNTAQLQFPLCTGGTATATHLSVGLASSGAGQIIYSGILNASLNISNNITPQIAISGLQISED